MTRVSPAPRLRPLLLAALAGIGLGPASPSAADAIDAEVKQLMKTVADSTNGAATRINAAKKLREIGEEKGKPAARALCQMAVPPGQARRAALDALEKVHPKLFPHVMTLIVDDESSYQYK